jgi:hypothetical protein
MKSIIIIAIAFVLLIPMPIFAQTDESVCKAISEDYVTGVGWQLNQKKYEECLDKAEKREFWMGARYWGVGIFFLILFGGIGIIALKRFSKPPTTYNDSGYSYTVTPLVRKGWTVDEKEKVRIRQDGKCAHCAKPPPRWEYHHQDGDRSNNSLENCEGLCPNCHSVETHES